MPIKPPGSILTFSRLAPFAMMTANLAVSVVKYRFDQVPFSRMEFDHDTLRRAKNIDGSLPVLVQLAGGRIVQYNNNCNPNFTTRPITPNDADVDNIYKRFDIKRYELVGAESLPDQIDLVSQVAQDHKVLLARFEAQLALARADVSFNFLQSLQLIDLSYLTNTGFSMFGRSLFLPAASATDTENNMLIIDFNPDVEREFSNDAADTSSTVQKTWTMTIESRTIVAQRSTVF